MQPQSTDYSLITLICFSYQYKYISNVRFVSMMKVDEAEIRYISGENASLYSIVYTDLNRIKKAILFPTAIPACPVYSYLVYALINEALTILRNHKSV